MFLTIIVLISFQCVLSSKLFSDSVVVYKKSDYKGDLFPAKYLEADEAPTREDLDLFVFSLHRTLNYFSNTPNATDINRVLGLRLMQAVLKRTLRDYGSKLEHPHKSVIEDIVTKADNAVTHYQHMETKTANWSSIAYRLEYALRSGDVMASSIGDFKKDRLKKWLHSDFFMNKYTKRMDEASLDRYDYIYNIQTWENDIPNIEESDYCLGRIADTPEPRPDEPMQPCRQSRLCLAWLTMTPSTAYSLTHRVINILMRHLTRRCYLESEVVDDAHLDLLCAAMYREAVYVARRGFFARDVFLELVSFCGYRGHEEVHRVNWFRKVASWVDGDGCVAETNNFFKNATAIITSLLKITGNEDQYTNYIDDRSVQVMGSPCFDHVMALSTGTLALGIRYAVHHLYS